MKPVNLSFLLLFLLFFPNNAYSQDPTRFQNEVDALINTEFEIDATKPTVVFTGSSSIRMWNNLDEVFPSINAINTGFGGSHASDLIFYLDELILKHKPDRIFIYEGDNDIAASKTPMEILPQMTRLVNSIREELPDSEIFFISPKPSIARWSFKSEYEQLNEMLKTTLKSAEGVTFIDVWNPMLDASGEPMADIFLEDNLHMNDKGYEIWTEVISKAAGLPTNNPEYFKSKKSMNEASSSTKDKVVFMGNSITQYWSETSPKFFENNSFIERGISGQTTPQMLDRFKADVLDLKPEVVVILAGTNDIAGNTGPATNKMIQDNLKAMAEMAHSNGIKVILSSILPAYDYPWKTGTYPSQRIIEVNAWIKEYCEANNHIYLDYWSSMVDKRNGLKEEYTHDGVHTNKAGYELMESLVQPAIEKALSK